MSTQNLAKVSVIIPCYRCEQTLCDAVASIDRQTSRPAEVILVDDNSPPGTSETIRELAALYGEWIKTVSLTRNSGAGAARNAGWAIATQPYVAFLDADDTWHPEKIRIQHGFMARHPEVALCGHRLGVLARRRTCTPAALTSDYVAKNISRHSFLLRNAFSTPTVMVKRDIPFRFNELHRHAEDLFLWQQIAFAKMTVARVELTLAYVHKPLYGAAGLSADLWKMEAAELWNLLALYRRGNIDPILLVGSTVFSLVKFTLRVMRVGIRRLISVENV